MTSDQTFFSRFQFQMWGWAVGRSFSKNKMKISLSKCTKQMFVSLFFCEIWCFVFRLIRISCWNKQWDPNTTATQIHHMKNVYTKYMCVAIAAGIKSTSTNMKRIQQWTANRKWVRKGDNGNPAVLRYIYLRNIWHGTSCVVRFHTKYSIFVCGGVRCNGCYGNARNE